MLSRLIRVGTEGDSTDDRLTDEELRDQLVTLLLAGHETTATALAWALYDLGRSPSLLARSRPRRSRVTTTGSRRCSRSRCGCTR
ncbi:cytochrome P450 [Nocardioides sp. B-3]|uniref:cytochrome P450 n=1 Tax=Nocardioides sp. B-3 TaxID=2895565 RepID=UPI0021535FE2|nr:cytochrome P450 [Nocardioides sp. B-3]